jgi:uncharacterized protein DUF3291
MATWHVAQMNVGTLLHPVADPRIAEFVSLPDQVNAVADASPGFVWRLQSAGGNATGIPVSDNAKFIVNMSVWQSVAALFDFIYRGAHRMAMARRRTWFQPRDGAYQVLWWVPAGSTPAVEEGLERLHRLRHAGPSQQAFTFRAKYPPHGLSEPPEDMQPQPYCVGWA